MEHEHHEADDVSDVDRRYTDSALGHRNSIASSTQTAPSVLVSFWEENGREYHAVYYLPTDDEEYARQDFQYLLCLETFGTISFSCHNTTVHRVLDAGCGRGLWATAFAEPHPESEAISIDIARSHCENVPPNVQPQIDDLEEQWNFSSKFDYIHTMMMNGAFKNWPAFYAQAFEFLSPNGWVEVKDMDFPLHCADGSLPRDSALYRWSNLMMEASRQSGYYLDTSGKASCLMHQAGFVDTVRIPFKWPVGSWPADDKMKRLGVAVRQNFYYGIEAPSLALFTRILHWSPERVREFVPLVQRDIMNPSYHAYFDVFVTYGRKE